MIPWFSPTSPYCQLPRKIKNFVVLLALLSQHALPLWGPPTSTLSDVRVRAGHEGSRLRMSRVVQARARVVLTTSLTLALRAAVKRQQTEEIGSPLASNTFPTAPRFSCSCSRHLWEVGRVGRMVSHIPHLHPTPTLSGRLVNHTSFSRLKFTNTTSMRHSDF